MFVLKWARSKIGSDCIHQSYQMCSLLMEIEMEPHSSNRFNRALDWQILGLLLPKHDTTDKVRNTIQLNTTRHDSNSTQQDKMQCNATRHITTWHEKYNKTRRNATDTAHNTIQLNATRHNSNSTQQFNTTRHDLTRHDTIRHVRVTQRNTFEVRHPRCVV
jgi:hypothetical protein